MKILIHAMTGPPCGIPPRFSRITRFMQGMAGILMALLVHGAGEVRGQTVQGSYALKLEWNASSSTGVTGYRIHYGPSSGTYTTSIGLGKVTSTTVSGLVNGVTYHFAVTAINAAGAESDYSNEVNHKPGHHTSDFGIAANGEKFLFLRGLIGSLYDIEASEDLKTWDLIDIVVMPAGGSMKYSDPDAASYPKRFYRTRQR